MTKFPSGNDPSSNGPSSNGPSSSGPSGDGAPAHIDSVSAGRLGLTVDTAWETNTESPHRKPIPKQTSSARTDVQWPLFLSPVQAVFPSPADDSMKEIGIHDGDIIVVDRSVEPSGGDVIVAALDGELTGKRYRMRGGQLLLMPENPDCAPIPIEEG